MASATFETDLAGGFAEVFEQSFASVAELSPQEAQAVFTVCDLIHTLFKRSRATIESALHEGVEAQAFVAKYKPELLRLEKVRAAVNRVLTKLRAVHFPALGEEAISRYEDLDRDLADLRQLLLDALANAEKPSRPIDWQHVRTVEEAYSRGETKPFRKTAKGSNGS